MTLDVKKGDVFCFENDGGFFGFGINGFQGLDDWYTNEDGLPIDPDRITHVAFAISNTQYVESSLLGVRLMPISKLKGKKVWQCILKPEIRKQILLNPMTFDRFVNEQIGIRYDFAQIGFYALNLLSFGLYEPKDDARYNVCSELLYRAFSIAGIKGKESNPSIVTPSDVFAEDWYIGREKLYE